MLLRSRKKTEIEKKTKGKKTRRPRTSPKEIFFKKYANEDEIITEEGLKNLCNDLGYDMNNDV